MTQEPKFVPGEQVVILSSNTIPESVGELDVVVSVRFYDKWRTGGSPCFGYKTKNFGHVGNWAWREEQLSKLPPDTPAQFDESIWVPKKEVV